MIKSIKLKDARELIKQRNVDGLFYIDKVSSADYMEIIFKKGSNNQLYSFWYHKSDGPYLGITIDTVQKFDSLLTDDMV